MLIIWLLCVFGLIAQSNSIKNVSKDKDLTDDQSATATTNQESKLDLDKAESKDSQVEIIKQIRRVNDDGSYTVGYEADDGTFKIESRDVLGNVKGTYGYVDENGEIKRVSYTANNSSNGLKSSTTPAPTVEEVVHIPRQNRTSFTASSTTRRPSSLAYLTSSPPTTIRSNVIQPIPKRRILISSTEKTTYSTGNQFSSIPKYSDRTTATPRKVDPTTTIVYATSVPQKQVVNIRPTPLPKTTSFKPTEQRQPKSDKIEISDRVSKVHVNQVLSTTEKPVVEETEEKERERKPHIRGNFLRRQLPEDNLEQFEAQEQVVYSQSAGEDSNPIYGGVSGNVRQLYSTTSSPRIPALVLAARARATNLQKNTVTSTPQTTSTTERVYSKPPRRKQDRRVDDEPTTESAAENYHTQSPIPVQIPANRDTTQTDDEHENRVYRQQAYLPRAREYVRVNNADNTNQREYTGPRQYRIPIPRTYTTSTLASVPSDGEQYLRETTDAAIREKASTTTSEQEQYAAAEPTAPQQPTPFTLPHNRQYLPYQPPYPTGFDQQQQQYPPPYSQYGPYYRPNGGGPGPGSGYNNLDRPLTARDFERLLNLLVLRQQQFQRFNYPQLPINPYLGYPGLGGGGGLGGGLGGGGGYNPYPSGYSGYPHVPRPPLYNPYDPRNIGYSRLPLPPAYGTAIYNEDENMYQAQNPIPEQQQPYSGQRLVPRKRQYNPQFYGAPVMNYPQAPAGDFRATATGYPDEAQNQVQAPPGPQTDYLPPEIREELLYRMLMLAIHAEQAAMHDASAPQEYIKSSTSTTAATIPAKFRKPVRSVQILGEE